MCVCIFCDPWIVSVRSPGETARSGAYGAGAMIRTKGKGPMTEKARRILVVDDSEVMLGRIKRALVEAGDEGVATDQVVGNGRHMKTCDLAIIDFHMPGLSGDAVTASLPSATSQRDKPCALYLYTTDQAA